MKLVFGIFFRTIMGRGNYMLPYVHIYFVRVAVFILFTVLLWDFTGFVVV